MATSSGSVTRRAENSLGVLSWAAVVFVGLVVIALVVGLQLFPRLSSGQRVLDSARPAFTDTRVAGDRAGITMVSNIVSMADPAITDPRTPAEVKGLIAYVAANTGLTQTQVVTALQSKAPHSLALLQALPLQSVADELPLLIGWVSAHSNLSPEVVTAAVNQSFPHLAQAIAALPHLTAGWNSVPGTDGLTRFDGSAVQTVPQVRDYLAGDVVTAVEGQRANFQQLDGTSPRLLVIPSVLLAIGAIAVVYGLVMLMLVRRIGVLHAAPRRRRFAFRAWAVIAVLGVVVLGLIPVWSLFGRLNAGSQVVSGLRPAFTDARVSGDVAGVGIISTAVDVLDPVMLRAGGGADEVPKLFSLVATVTGLPQAQVVQTIQQSFPHTFALLNAIPLESVTAELSGLTGFVSTALKVTPAQLTAVLHQSFPQIAQIITFLPVVSGGWADVPGTGSLTRFDGSPVRTVPQVRDYFMLDVIPMVASVRSDYQNLDGLPVPVNWVPPLLLIAGVLVLYYGLVMMYIWRPRPQPAAAVDFTGTPTPAVWA